MSGKPRTSFAGIALVLSWLLSPAQGDASVITGTYYATGDSLRVVDFDGTGFLGGATVLENLIPDWTAMS